MATTTVQVSVGTLNRLQRLKLEMREKAAKYGVKAESLDDVIVWLLDKVEGKALKEAS